MIVLTGRCAMRVGWCYNAVRNKDQKLVSHFLMMESIM